MLLLLPSSPPGKTTQIPQYLHEAGYTKLGAIACTQPRSAHSRTAHPCNTMLRSAVSIDNSEYWTAELA